jgi:hypothetical protein
MKKLVGSCLGVLLALSVPGLAGAQPTAPVSAEDAARLNEAHAIIEVIFPTAEREKMIDKMMTDITAPMRQSLPFNEIDDPGLKAIFKDYLDQAFERQRPLLYKHMPILMGAMAVAYSHEFTLAELQQVHAFAVTPAGHHYLSRSTALIGDPAVQKVNTAMMADAQALTKTMIVEFKARLLAYLKDHPDAAAKLSAVAKDK